MKLLLTLFSLLSLTQLHSSTWNPTPPGEILDKASSTEVVCAPTPTGATPNRFIATFAHHGGAERNPEGATTYTGYYNLYDTLTHSWQPYATELPLASVVGPVYCAYGDGINLITSTIGGTGTSVAYTVYDGSTFTPEDFVPNSPNSNAASGVVSPSYNSFGNVFLTTWTTLNLSDDSNVPAYAIYDPTGPGSWGAGGVQLNVSAPNNFISAVYSASNPTNGNALITWAAPPSQTNPGIYFIYSPLASLGSATGALIPVEAYSAATVTTAFPIYDPNSGKFIVTWIDFSTGFPFFTIFDGSSWTTPAQIPLSDAAELVGVYASVDPATGILLFTWVDSLTARPIYVTYDSTLVNPWGTPAPIPETPTTYNQNLICSTFDTSSAQFMVTWSGNDLPEYDTLSLLIPTTTTVTTSPNPSNVFQKVTFTATISPSVGPTGTVVFYVNGTRVGQAPVISGVATLDPVINCGGDSIVKAVYSGDSVYGKSFGSAVHTVNCLTLGN